MQIVRWKPGDPTLLSSQLAIDTETHMIVDHTLPPVVCMQIYGGGDEVHFVDWQYIEQYLANLFGWNPRSDYIFHNSAFDIGVLGYPDFLLKAADEGRVKDTQHRHVLWQLHNRGYISEWSLKDACKTILGAELDKDEAIRCAFSKDTPPTQEQVQYAVNDAIYTWLLNHEIPTSMTHTDDIQTRAGIALDDMSRRGMLVDDPVRQELNIMFKKRLENTLQILDDNGFIPEQKGNQADLERILLGIEKVYKIDFPRTDTGKMSVSKESLADLPDEIPFIKALKEYDHCNKMLETYLETKNIGVDGRVHSRFQVIIKTGRTSSSSPNVQNLPRADGIRGLFIPTIGFVYLATDYGQQELFSLGQHCLRTYGESQLAETLNSGVDVHKFLASKIFRIDIKEVTKDQRSLAKAASFGLPGGLSAKTFVTYARGYGANINEAQAQEVKDIWLRTFPEMSKHLKPNYDSATDSYYATTLTGRTRGKCSYCEACNYVFQAVSADVSKTALWKIYRKKKRAVNFIHVANIS